MLQEVLRSLGVIALWSVLAFGLLLAAEFSGLHVDSPTTGILAMAIIASTFVMFTEGREWLRSHRVVVEKR
jgi:hypothetical protein